MPRSGVSYSVRIPAMPAAVRRMNLADEKLRRAAITATKAAVKIPENDAAARAPRRSQTLARSISHKLEETATGARAQVGVFSGPAAAYAAAVEKGRKPGKPQPPIRALMRSMHVDARAAFLIGRSIKRKGIKAQPFLRPAMAATRSRVRQVYKAELTRAVAAIAGGGGGR